MYRILEFKNNFVKLKNKKHILTLRINHKQFVKFKLNFKPSKNHNY